MTSFKRLLNFVTLVFLLHAPLAMAQVDRAVQLSRPVGGDVLPGGQVLESDIKSSAIFSKVIPFAIKYAIRIAMVLSVIAIIIGGYQFMTAYGDSEKRKTAQKTITYAIIGLVLAITAFGIVNIVSTIQFTAPTE